MKNTVKYIAIHIEIFLLLLVFCFGVLSADNGLSWLTVTLIFGPFVLGRIFNVDKQIEFCQIYDRALNIKLKQK